jgi:prepilin-type processing-associated H-X9-DG protein
LRHGKKTNVWFIDGHAETQLMERLRECYTTINTTYTTF